MDFSLTNFRPDQANSGHGGYELNPDTLPGVLGHVVTGGMYGSRHWKIALSSTHDESYHIKKRLWHGLIGTLEFIPIVGSVIAVADKYFAKKLNSSNVEQPKNTSAKSDTHSSVKTPGASKHSSSPTRGQIKLKNDEKFLQDNLTILKPNTNWIRCHFKGSVGKFIKWKDSPDTVIYHGTPPEDSPYEMFLSDGTNIIGIYKTSIDTKTLNFVTLEKKITVEEEKEISTAYDSSANQEVPSGYVSSEKQQVPTVYDEDSKTLTIGPFPPTNVEGFDA